MEITLKVIKVLPAQSGVSKSSGKQWLKQEFIGETEDQYPRNVCVTVFNPDDHLQIPLVGDRITASIDIESRSWTGRDGVERWSTEVKAYKIVVFSGQAKSGPDATFTRVVPPEPPFNPAQYQVPQAPQPPVAPTPSTEDDDLPF